MLQYGALCNGVNGNTEFEAEDKPSLNGTCTTVSVWESCERDKYAHLVRSKKSVGMFGYRTQSTTTKEYALNNYRVHFS
jgi:hypothetical protein